MDLPRSFTIRESSHRIHNPLTSEKLAAFGRALALPPGATALDLASGSGELLCTWARDHRLTGTGVDISTAFTARAQARAAELGVGGLVRFVHGDAAGHVAERPVDLASCVGATWIGGGVAGTVELLARSLRPGGLMLIGEPFWLRTPPDQVTVESCHASDVSDFLSLPGLLGHFAELGYDVVEMMLADPDKLGPLPGGAVAEHPPLARCQPRRRTGRGDAGELTSEPLRYARYEREFLGWGVFALMRR